MIQLSRIAAVFILVTLLSCASTNETREPRVLGNRLVFELPDLEGNTVRSSDARFEGKVLLVTLWGTWCPPCLTEIPTFNDLQARYGDDDLVVVGIAFERDTVAAARQDRLRRFSQKRTIRYLVLDGGETSDFSTALPMVDEVRGLPVEITVDRSGVVVEARNGYGYTEEWARELETSLKSLLAGEL